MKYIDVSDCGHHIAYLFKLRERSGLYQKFCMGCLFEKLEHTDIAGRPVKNYLEEEKKVIKEAKSVSKKKSSKEE